MTKYTDFTTSEGNSVRLRPRSFAEWEAHEEMRLEAVKPIREAIAREDSAETEYHARKLLLDMRKTVLNTCVENFDQKSHELSLREIDEIEREIEVIEKLGNSANGGNGTLTENGANTVQAAAS